MKNKYIVVETEGNMFYKYAVVEVDDINLCPICYCDSPLYASRICIALNDHGKACSKGV